MKMSFNAAIILLTFNMLVAQVETEPFGHNKDCGPRLRAPFHSAPLLITPQLNIDVGIEYDCCNAPKNYNNVRFNGQTGGRTTGSVGGRTIDMKWELTDPELLYQDDVLEIFPGANSDKYWWNFKQEAKATLKVTTDDDFALNKLIKLNLPVMKGVSVPIEINFGEGKTTQTTIIVFSLSATPPFPCDL
jgi:hypothetical protein